MNFKKLSTQKDYTALLLLLAMVLWFGHEMVLGTKVPFFRDLGTYSYPMRFSLAQSFESGELPLWDRHVAMGFPLLADFQSGAFYLPHLFYLIFPFFTAVRVIFLFHYLIAATGSYMLWRHWNYPPYLAVIGAILFTLGGTVVSFSNLLNHFQTAVWLPWVLFCGERFMRSQSGKNFLFVISVMLFQFLAGSPEVYAMSLGVLLLVALKIKREEEGLTYKKILSLLLITNLTVLGLAMVQLLPTIELFLESRGQSPILYPEATFWSLHPSSLINLFFLDKEVDTKMFNGVNLFFSRDIPFFVSYYMGAISLVGVCLWLFYASAKEKGIFIGLVIISLVIAMGRYTPVYPLLFKYVPLFNLFRFPEKFFFLSHAFLLFITLRGLFRFLQSDGSSSKGPLLVVMLVFFLLFLLYLFLRLDTEPLRRFIAWATDTPPLSPSTLDSSSAVLVHLERQIALSFGILLLLFFGKKRRLRAPLFNVLLVALVFIDLNSAHQPYQFLLNPDLVHKSPSVITAPDSEQNRLFYYPSGSHLHPNYVSVLAQPSFTEANALAFSNLLPNTGVFYGFDYMQEIDALGRRPYVVFLGAANSLPPEKLYRLLGALNVKFIISFRPLPPGDTSLVRHFPQYPSWLYRIDRVIPRTYIAPKVTEEKDPLKILDRLSSPAFDPVKEVILEQSLSIPSMKNFQAEANITRYTNQAVAIRASLNGSGVLILADSFYPGWRVYVDGREEKILRANFFFRGVSLSAGDHSVEFRYQPRSFTIGLIISLVTFCGAAIGSILLTFHHRWGA